MQVRAQQVDLILQMASCLQAQQAVIISGPHTSGKTTVWRTLARALALLPDGMQVGKAFIERLVQAAGISR